MSAFTLVDESSLDNALASFRKGEVRAVIVVPKDYSRAVAAAQTGVPNVGVAGASANLALYTDPSQQTTSGLIAGIVNAVVGRVNQGDRPSVIGVSQQAIQTENIGVAAYFVPSILAMALMGGAPFVPVALGVAVLAGWLIVCFGLSARYFRWQ